MVVLAVVLLPFLQPGGPANSSVADLAMAIAIVAAVVWAGSTGRSLRAPYVTPMALMLASGTLAALLGAYPMRGAVAVVQDVFLLAWCWTVANVVRTPGAMSRLLTAWAWAAGGWALVLAVAVATHQWTIAGVDPSQGTRAGLTFGDQNTAALYFLISLAVVLGSGQPRNPVARIVTTGLIAYALLLTGSLAGLLGTGICVTVAAFLMVRNRWGLERAVALTAPIGLVAGLVLFTAGQSAVHEARTSRNPLLRNSIGREEQSSSEREVLARETTSLYSRSGLLGLGPGATQPTLYAGQAPYPKEAHNDFIAALIERGVAGEAGLILLVVGIGVRTSVLAGRRLSTDFSAIVPGAPWLVGGVVGLIAFATTHEILHDRAVWSLLGVVAALHLWGRPAPVPAPIRGGEAT